MLKLNVFKLQTVEVMPKLQHKKKIHVKIAY